jgi:hypothetical protein
MQTNAPAILLPISLALLGLFGKFSFDMRRDRNYRDSWFWATAAVLPGLLSAFYLTSDPTMAIALRSVILGTLGAAVGACVAIWLGYVVSQPVSAQVAPGSAPPSPTAAPPSVTVQGGTAIFNFGTARDITQNSESKAREAIRDPDGIYQFDQKVAIVKAAETNRGSGLATFRELISQGDTLNPDKDFQYRQYILHLTGSDFITSAGMSGLTVKRWINARCEIKGIINPQESPPIQPVRTNDAR